MIVSEHWKHEIPGPSEIWPPLIRFPMMVLPSLARQWTPPYSESMVNPSRRAPRRLWKMHLAEEQRPGAGRLHRHRVLHGEDLPVGAGVDEDLIAGLGGEHPGLDRRRVGGHADRRRARRARRGEEAEEEDDEGAEVKPGARDGPALREQRRTPCEAR